MALPHTHRVPAYQPYLCRVPDLKALAIAAYQSGFTRAQLVEEIKLELKLRSGLEAGMVLDDICSLVDQDQAFLSFIPTLVRHFSCSPYDQAPS